MSNLPAPDALIPDTDPSCTITLHDLIDPFYTHLPSIHETNPGCTSLCLSFAPSFTATAYSYPSIYSLPLSPHSARSCSPAPSSSFSHHDPRDPDESYVLLPHEPYMPFRGDMLGFRVVEPATPSRPTSPTASRIDAGERIATPGPSSPTDATSSIRPRSPTPPTSSTDPSSSTPPTSSIRPQSPTPPTSSLRPRSPTPPPSPTSSSSPTTPTDPNSPSPPTPPTAPPLPRPLYPYPIRPARPILSIAQAPFLEVSERDPEIIALAVARTFERMATENRFLYNKWVAFRDEGVMEEAFIMEEEGARFDEGHRGVWREIQKRGVNSDLWNLPPAPPFPGTLPPHGESLAHTSRARYLAALDRHKSWRRTLRCSDPALLNTYEDVWFPQYLLSARAEILDANPHRELEQDAFRRREEHFALLQLQIVKSLTVRDEFQHAPTGVWWWPRKKELEEQERDVRRAEGKVPWSMDKVRRENKLQQERETEEMEERERKIQRQKDRDECGADWWHWFNTWAWNCRGRWGMPVLRYGRGTVNSAEIPCLVEAVSQVASWWEEDAYPWVWEDGYDPMVEAGPVVPLEMAGALADPFIPFIPAGALADPFVPAGEASNGGTIPLAAQEESVPSGSENGVAVAAPRHPDFPAQPVTQQPPTPVTPQHEEFLRRCNRSGVVVTAPRTESPAQPAVQDVAPWSDRPWYEEFLDYPVIRRTRKRRIPIGMPPWR